MPEQSYSVDSLAEAEGISRAMVYKLWSQGRGPRFYYLGAHRRITESARQEWHRQLEAEADALRGNGGSNAEDDAK